VLERENGRLLAENTHLIERATRAETSLDHLGASLGQLRQSAGVASILIVVGSAGVSEGSYLPGSWATAVLTLGIGVMVSGLVFQVQVLRAR
jgi:hypothetical protein